MSDSDDRPRPVLAFTKSGEPSGKNRKGDGVRRARQFISSYIAVPARERIPCAEVYDAYMQEEMIKPSKSHFVKALQEPDEFSGKYHFTVINADGESWIVVPKEPNP